MACIGPRCKGDTEKISMAVMQGWTQAQTDVHDRAYSGSNNRSKTEAVSAPLNPDSKHFNCLHENMYRCKCVVCAACVFVCVSMYTDKKGPKKILEEIHISENCYSACSS